MFIKEKLNIIRAPNTNITRQNKIIHTIIILVLGISMGCFSKWLDNMAVNDSVWWQHAFAELDLGNIFSEFPIWLLIALVISVFSSSPLRAAINTFLFFTGMCVSYHIYTVYFSGFNPYTYMKIWYGFTLLSPLLAAICWYAKGKSLISCMISVLVLSIMAYTCFAIGCWYFDVRRNIYVLFFAVSVAVLYKNPKQMILSATGGIALSFILSYIIPFT